MFMIFWLEPTSMRHLNTRYFRVERSLVVPKKIDRSNGWNTAEYEYLKFNDVRRNAMPYLLLFR